ncbi:hypothetical protein FBR05_08880 [Deltaproteobacteria bacterium PRO3]|nr:hypothetical protein [Deltaproteobacteria bacterium PRO3]
MRQVLSWVLAMSCLFPVGLSAQQEALLLKILTEVQRSSRPTVENPAEAKPEAPLLEDVWDDLPKNPEATESPQWEEENPEKLNP